MRTHRPPAALFRHLVLPALLLCLAAACGGGEGGAPMRESEEMAAMSGASTTSAPAADAAQAPSAQGRAEGLTGGEAATVADTASGAAPPQEPGQGAAQGPASTVLPTMIIRTGMASVQVDSLERGIAQVQALARRMGGFIANTNIQSGDYQVRSAVLEIKLPAARFEQAVSGLQPLGKVESVNVTAQDVGEEFVDVSARMANARRLEERLVQLLATRTGKLEDVLTVERELARVREEIERYEGRLRYLRTRAAVSTLTVTVHEPAAIGQYPARNPILAAFGEAWRNFIDFVAGFIALLGTLVPMAVILFAALLILRRAWRFLRSREKKPDTAAPPPQG